MSHAPAQFLYMAARTDGRRTLGKRLARDERALAEHLRGDRLLLLKSWRVPGGTGEDRGLSLKDRAELNQQLAQLLVRGVPLVEALEVTSTTVAPAARDKVNRMRELVSAGSSFSDACAAVGSFDVVTIAVYRAAERTGDLAGAAGQLAKTARRQLAVAGKAVTVAIYPALVLVVSSLATSVLLIFVVPQIGKMMSESGAEVNAFSRIVFWIGITLRGNLGISGLVLIGVLVGCFLGRRFLIRGIGRAGRKLPVMRELLLAQEATRFFSVMGAMTRSGIPLADALGVGNEAVHHPLLRSQLEKMRQDLIEGGVLRFLIDDVTAFPLAIRRLLIAAERSGDLETAFDNLADDTALEVERRSERLLAVLEPILIVMIFLMIGSVVLAIMIPMLTMAGQVAG